MVDGSQKALVSDLVSTELKGSGYGLYHAIIGISLLPASFITGRLYDNVNSSPAFYFGAIMAFIAAIHMIVFFKIFEERGKEIITNLDCKRVVFEYITRSHP